MKSSTEETLKNMIGGSMRPGAIWNFYKGHRFTILPGTTRFDVTWQFPFFSKIENVRPTSVKNVNEYRVRHLGVQGLNMVIGLEDAYYLNDPRLDYSLVIRAWQSIRMIVEVKKVLPSEGEMFFVELRGQARYGDLVEAGMA